MMTDVCVCQASLTWILPRTSIEPGRHCLKKGTSSTGFSTPQKWKKRAHNLIIIDDISIYNNEVVTKYFCKGVVLCNWLLLSEQMPQFLACVQSVGKIEMCLWEVRRSKIISNWIVHNTRTRNKRYNVWVSRYTHIFITLPGVRDDLARRSQNGAQVCRHLCMPNTDNRAPLAASHLAWKAPLNPPPNQTLTWKPLPG